MIAQQIAPAAKIRSSKSEQRRRPLISGWKRLHGPGPSSSSNPRQQLGAGGLQQRVSSIAAGGVVTFGEAVQAITVRLGEAEHLDRRHPICPSSDTLQKLSVSAGKIRGRRPSRTEAGPAGRAPRAMDGRECLGHLGELTRDACGLRLLGAGPRQELHELRAARSRSLPISGASARTARDAKHPMPPGVIEDLVHERARLLGPGLVSGRTRAASRPPPS